MRHECVNHIPEPARRPKVGVTHCSCPVCGVIYVYDGHGDWHDVAGFITRPRVKPVAKTAAEIQRAKRARIKADPEKYDAYKIAARKRAAKSRSPFFEGE